MAPRPILNRAIAAHVSARHLAVLIGPSLGGVLYIFGPVFDYGVCTTLVLAAFIARCCYPIQAGRRFSRRQPRHYLAGFRFIWRCEVILGCDAVRVRGGAVRTVSALFPIYARDILQTGALGAASCVARRARRLDRRRHAQSLSDPHNGGLWLYSGLRTHRHRRSGFGVSQSLCYRSLP